MSRVTQLDPPIHLWIPEREDFGLAHFLIYEGPEEYLYFVCFMQKTGECWTFDNRKVRGDVNFTLDRVYQKRPRQESPGSPPSAPKTGTAPELTQHRPSGLSGP